MSDLRLFALKSSRPFAEQVAQRLGLDLAPLEERDFPDGEHRVQPLCDVYAKDVYLIQSLHDETGTSLGDKLMRTLFLSATLVDASAARVSLIAPYLCYARQDQQQRPGEPVATRHLARLVEAAGVSRIATLDVHDLAAWQNAYRCRTSHLTAAALFARHFANLLQGEPVTVVSPDAGGVRRAEHLRQALQTLLHADVPMALLEKHRDEDAVRAGVLAGHVAGRVAIIYDDLISTGATMLLAAQACKAQGAQAIHAAATHAVSAQGLAAVAAYPAIAGVVVSNSIPLTTPQAKVEVLNVAPLFGDAIWSLHRGPAPAAR